MRNLKTISVDMGASAREDKGRSGPRFPLSNVDKAPLKHEHGEQRHVPTGIRSRIGRGVRANTN